MPSLKYWHRAPGSPRVYIDGLTDQHWRDNKVYAYAWDEGYKLASVGATPDQFAQALAYCTSIGPMWADLLRACNMVAPGGTPAPLPAFTPESARTRLESALQVHVAAAARAAGVAFRNGLGKAEIIDLCLSSHSRLPRIISALDSLQAGHEPKAPAPTPRPGNPADWFDDETPAPTPTVDLSAYALKREVQAEFSSLEASLKPMHATVAEHTAAIADLQSRRPVEYHVPGKPAPIPHDKLTHYLFGELIDALAVGEHVLLVGPAGSGKTTHAQMAAEILGRRLYKAAPASHTGEILGYMDAHSRYVRTSWRDAYEHGNSILLADEFDSSCADAPLAANPILDKSGLAAFPDGMIARGADFSCILGTNTDGTGATMQYAGRIRMDGAFRDRFAILQWGYDPRIEEAMAGQWQDWRRAVQGVREFADKRGILDTCATPRATQRGRVWLEAGKLTRERICEREFKLGAFIECWRDVLALPAVSAFLKGA